MGEKNYSLIPVQWMVAGQSGLPGRSVHKLVARETEPGSGPAVTRQLDMEAGHVTERQWRSSCAVSGLVRVRKYILF